MVAPAAGCSGAAAIAAAESITDTAAAHVEAIKRDMDERLMICDAKHARLRSTKA
jgi:hypothetical protein